MSTQRAFVIQFQPRTTATPERFAGRVEHVGSGDAIHFASPPELLAFLSRQLGSPVREARKDAVAPPPPTTGARRRPGRSDVR